MSDEMPGEEEGKAGGVGGGVEPAELHQRAARLAQQRAREAERAVRIGRAARDGRQVMAQDVTWVEGQELRDQGPESVTELPVSAGTAMRVLGISAPTFSRLKAEGLPCLGRNQYLLGPVVQFAVDRALRQGRESRGKGELEGRKLRAQARKIELEYEIMSGRHVPRDTVVRSIERAIVEARGTLENLPVLVGAIVPAGTRVEVADRVREIVESALKSLAEGGRMPAAVQVEETADSDGMEAEDDLS